MDKHTWIGFGLIAIIIVSFSLLNRPSKEELERRQHYQDSIAYVRQMEQEAEQLSKAIAMEEAAKQSGDITEESITEKETQINSLYGTFAVSARGVEEEINLENELIRLTIANHGGRIVKAELKNYKA